MDNVGSTILLHPVFNNLEQVIIFRRVVLVLFAVFLLQKLTLYVILVTTIFTM